ncbi:hypothetical protein JZU57_00175, partial [bacterium]|nr:hypothetical protein [bacterium]
LTELVDAIKKVVEPIQKLAKIGAVLKDAYKVATTIKGATESARKLDTFKDDEAATKLTDTDWKVLRERFQGALGASIQGEDKISGANEYLEGGRILAIYGEAMYAAHLNITRLMEHIINLTMRRKMYEAQMTRLASYENREAETEEAFAEAQLLLRQRYLDVKRGLLFELEDFGDAYRYWALREPNRSKLRLMPRAAQMSELRVGLQSMIDEGLDGLFPVAQQPVLCHIRHELSMVERNMLARGEPVIVRAPPIEGWARVRINNLQGVTLDNLTGTSGNLGKNLRCHVRSSGAFVDSWGGNTFEFAAPTSQEFSRSFIVGAVADGRRYEKNIILSADGGEPGGDLGRFANMPYYLPGLYTNWSVRLPRGLGDNDAIDVSGVEVIRDCMRKAKFFS